jgi:hypothetical protein
MAGAGYKLFNTGDVLTAAQVNTYLMEQTVMVFANAAARTTALSGVVSEGMISYLKDTNAVEVYDGSNWVSSDDPNAIQNSIINAKGDLIAGSANDTPAILSVGNSGETIVADSAASTGLRWQGDYSAGKNKIINGDFGIWQRGTSITLSNGAFAYTADRFEVYTQFSAGSSSFSQQTFTAGTAPVAGYEGTFFGRLTCGSTASYFDIAQKIESVRTFAGQTATLSFWAKASGSIVITPYLIQNFGSGGSSNVNTAGSTITLTTSWTRYTVTLSVPSISGKTIGAGNYLSALLAHTSGSLNSATIDTWGWQVEAGNVATAFQTATGTIQGELAACQRYYWRTGGLSGYQILSTAYAKSATEVQVAIPNPVPMRVIPTVVDASTLGFQEYGGTIRSMTSVTLDGASSPTCSFIYATIAGSTAGYVGKILINNSTSGYLGFGAEL